MTGRAHWSEVDTGCQTATGPARPQRPLIWKSEGWDGNPKGGMPVNGLSQPLLQTKNRSRFNKVLFLFMEAAWKWASCSPDPFDSTDIYGLCLSCALSFPFFTDPLSQFSAFLSFLMSFLKDNGANLMVLQGLSGRDRGVGKISHLGSCSPGFGASASLSVRLSFPTLLCFRHHREWAIWTKDLGTQTVCRFGTYYHHRLHFIYLLAKVDYF